MSTLSFTAQQLYNMLTDAHCNCKQYISVAQNDLLILANESRNSYGVFEDIPITKDFIIEYDLTLGSNNNPCCNPTFGSYIKPNSAQYYGFMLSFSAGGELWRGENNSPTTSQQSLGMSGTAWYGTPNTTYHIKIERDDNTINLYIDNVLTQTVSDETIRTTGGGYFGFFNWDGHTCKISNVTVTSDTYSNIKKYINNVGLAEVWANIKNYIAAQLLGKSNVGHTHSASDITSGLATVATSGSYNDLSNKPTIPTVNNATLTIQKNGTTVKTFTANASSNVTCNITVPTKTSDLTNDSGFITEDTTKIPLAGSNQISGSLIPATDNSIDVGSSTKNIKMLYTKGITINGTQFLPSDYLPKTGSNQISGDLIPTTNGTVKLGSNSYRFLEGYFGKVFCSGLFGHSDSGIDINYTIGANLILRGKNRPSETGIFWLVADNGSSSSRLMGAPSGTLTWNGQAVQTTSDQRLKQQISEIDNALLDAWEDVNLVQFKYNDAVDQKKDKARLHTGYVVQQIDDACKSHNVDISKYGLYCHEEYAEETREVEQADGTKKTEVVRPANEHYSLRYTEALIVECAYLRKCIKELRAEIEELKSSK